MNNLNYTSYSEPVVAVSTSVLVTDTGEPASAHVPDNVNNSYELNQPAIATSNNEMATSELLSFSNYQPIANGTILPVHQLLF